MARITINGVSIDPEADAPEIKAAGLDSPGAAKSNYILVQTPAPLAAAQREQLAAAGATLLSRERTDPPDAGATYLCEFPDSNFAPVLALPFVTAALVYPNQVKVAPELLTAAGNERRAKFSHKLAAETGMAQDPRDVLVVLHPDAGGDGVLRSIATAARVDAEGLELDAGTVRLRVAPQLLDRLARLDAVHHIEEYAQPKLLNHVALGIMRVDTAHAANLDGGGEIVAVCDTGFDLGLAQTPHPAFAGRVKTLYAIGRPGRSDDPNGHGTHVAGSVLGSGHSSVLGESVDGAAPGAQLVLQSVLDASGNLRFPTPFRDLFGVPYQKDGARIHTNSWGSTANLGRYTPLSASVDEFVWQQRDCLICFAAGNDGHDRDGDGQVNPSSICPPATAKNCLAVGASESERPALSKAWGAVWPADYPQPPIRDDLWADNRDGVAPFSGRGPTQDGRYKPDVVAPGTAILSAHSRAANVGPFWGASADSLYCFMGGTSMATPLVAGAAAVLRQHLRNIGAPRPSAALLKALLINGAENITGQYEPTEAATVPNNAEGFGRVNLLRTISAGDGERIDFHDEAEALDVGEQRTFAVNAPAGTHHLKVTLVWTDPPGASLQNDLDLIVRIGNKECHGNRVPGDAGFDRYNNVEQVDWRDRPPGKIEVVVRAYDVPRFRQSFALVIRSMP